MSEPMQVTMADAYTEACQALGDALVQQRLVTKAAAAQIAALTAERDAALAKTEPETART